MDFTEGQRRLLAYWGNIQAAVAERVSTAELWSRVRAAAEQEGVSLHGVGAIDMGRLRSIAAAQRGAMAALGGARRDQAITGAMIASDLSARPLQDQLLAPSWIVRFEHDIVVEGELRTVWRSSVVDGGLPATVQDLYDRVSEDAEAMAEDYDVSHAGVGRIQISAV